MRQLIRPVKRRPAGISWAPVLFLLGFLAAIGVLALFFFEPVLRMANEGTPQQRVRIAAYGALALCLAVLILLVGLVLTMRVGRRLSSLAPGARPKPTTYTDAWAESARRMQPPPVDDLEGPHDQDVEKPRE